jgi:hypothetical protein
VIAVFAATADWIGMTPIHSIAALLATAIFAGAGVLGFGHASAASPSDAGAFGAPLAHVHVQPIYRERGATATSLREVPCDGPNSTARCFVARSSG